MNTNDRDVCSVALLTATLVFAVSVLFPEGAFAAANSKDWIKPATDMVDVLRSGFVQIGAVIVGLLVAVRGVIFAWGEADWKKMGLLLFGGFLIISGPEIIATLLEAAQ